MCKVYSFHTMYAKVFSRITESSLMEEEIPVRYTFVMLLAIADPTGLVVGTDVALARRLNMPLAEFQKCISALQNEDPDSNSKEEAGRRIIPSIGERGYQLVNFVKYRDMRDEESKRRYMREYMREYRSKDDVNSCKENLTVLGQAEAESEAQVEENSYQEREPWKGVEKCYRKETRMALAYLNEKCGRHYREVAGNLDLIDARLSEDGVTLEGVKRMIDRQCARWSNTPQREFLRPTTLFDASKFDGYYAGRDQPLPPTNAKQADKISDSKQFVKALFNEH